MFSLRSLCRGGSPSVGLGFRAVVGSHDPSYRVGDGVGDGSGPSVEDLRRIDRYQQLIDARKPDGTPWYGEHVRRFFEGEIFNIENHYRYPVNELHVTKPGSGFYSRVDSFVPDQEVVSRKQTQLAEIDPRTAGRYLTEIGNKYGLDRREIVIADTPSNRRDLTAAGFDPGDYIGRRLSGQHVLEIPVQRKPPPLDFLRKADAKVVTVRDAEGTTWAVSADKSTVIEVRADGTTVAHPSPEGDS